MHLVHVQKRRIPVFGSLALLWLATIDIFTRVPLGSLSVSGLLTISGAVFSLVMAYLVTAQRLSLRSRLGQPGVSHELRRGTPPFLVAFSIYATIRLMAAPSAEGIQNVSVYVSFAGAIACMAAFSGGEAPLKLLEYFRAVSAVVALIAGVSFALGFQVYGQRAFALAALVALAAIVPLPVSRWWHHFVPFLIVLAIVLSLSRTALAISIALLPFLVLRDRMKAKVVRWVVLVGAMAGLSAWLITDYAPIRDRFIEGDNAVNVGGVALNTSGRTMIWDIVARSWETSPNFGLGPGSANALLSSMYANIGHPHNDYLRILHDFGWFGLGLFAVGYVALIAGAIGRARRSNATLRTFHFAAVLVLCAVAAAAFTDNVLVYPFVMIPAGAVVGASLSAESYYDRAVGRARGAVSAP